MVDTKNKIRETKKRLRIKKSGKTYTQKQFWCEYNNKETGLGVHHITTIRNDENVFAQPKGGVRLQMLACKFE